MADSLQTLSEIFTKRLFRVPDYQRGYAWQQSQLVDFWEDLNNIQDTRYHYTGQLTLKALPSKGKEDKGEGEWIEKKGYRTYHVVDGQQRLTSIVILLNELICFFRELDSNKGKTDDNIYLDVENLKDIKTQYISQKKPPHETITTYLFGYETDNPSYEYLRYKVFDEPFSGEIAETYYTRNLKNAKDFFADNISALYEEGGEDGLIRLYVNLTQKLKFNVHEIDDDYDVYVSFETMNNRGKKLTNLELLKNRLIYLTTVYDDNKYDEEDKNELRKKINEAWKEVYYQLGKNKTGVLSDDEFLRAHWIIYYAYSRNKGNNYIRYLLDKFSAKNVFEKRLIVNQEDMPSILEEEIDSDPEIEEEASSEDLEQSFLKLEPKEIEDYVNSLKELAKYWHDTYFPYESSTLSDNEKLWIDRINRIKVSYFRPLITAALCRGNDPNERVELFKAIERFIFVCFRLATYRSDYQSSVYYKAAKEIYYASQSIAEVTEELNKTTDENIQFAIRRFADDIEKKFNSGKQEGYYAWRTLRYFLFEYEYKLREDTGIKKISWELFSKTENDMVTIEHILPRSPSKWYWKNQFRQFIDNPIEMAFLTGALGNLLPLSQSINSSLQNDSFEEKKNPPKKDRRGYTEGSNSEIEVSKENDWNATSIHERTAKLLTFMSERWNIPLSDEQKTKLEFDEFINDGRAVPDELPIIPDSVE